MKLRDMYETISPLLIETKATSITLGLSRRFFLFSLMGKIIRRIEDDPYLNFISLLKYYKILMLLTRVSFANAKILKLKRKASLSLKRKRTDRVSFS